MAVGLSSKATITIDVDVQGESLEELRRSMAALGKAVNTKTAQASMERMEETIKDLKDELRTTQEAMRDTYNEMDAMSDRHAAQLEESEKQVQEAMKKSANIAKTSAANAANAYKRGEAAQKKRSAAAKKGAQTRKQNQEEEEARQKKAAQFLMAFVATQKTADQQMINSANERSLAAQAAVVREQQSLNKSAAAYRNKQQESKNLRAFMLALNFATAKVIQSAREEEIAQEQAAQAVRERADKMKMYASLYDQIDAKEKRNTDRLKRQAEIGEMITRIGKKRAAAEKEAVMSRTRSARQASLIMRMEQQGGDYLQRNEKLYRSLKHATTLSTKELHRYNRAVRESIGLQKQHNAALKGKSGQGFLSDLRYNLSHYEKQMDAIFRASFRMQMVGNNLKMFARDIARWGSQIMDTFGEFEFMMNRAAGALEIWRDKSIDGAKGTDVLSEAIQVAAEEVMLFPAYEIAESLYYWGSATGQVVDTVDDLNVAMGSMIPIMKVAAMTNTGYEETVKGVYSVLTQFYKGQLEYAPQVTKTLFFITQKTAAEFKDLISSFKMVGPVAAQVGVSFEEVASIFGRLSDLGLRASMSGRGFRQLFIQLLRPSGPAKKKIEELWNTPGVQELFGGKGFTDVVFEGGKFIGMENYMKVLYQATQQMEDYERQAFLARISTANSLPIITALVNDYGRELVGLKDIQENKLITDKKVNEFFEENWNLLSNSWKAVSGSVQRSIERIILLAGGGIAEALTPFADAIKDLAEQFREFIEMNPEIVRLFAKIAAGVGVVAALAGVLFTLVGALAGLGAAIYLAVQSFKPWFGALAGVIGFIGILTAAVVRNADYIRTRLTDAVEIITEAYEKWEREINIVGDTFQSFVRGMGPMLDNLVQLVVDFAVAIADLVAYVIDLDRSMGGLISGSLSTMFAIFVGSKFIQAILLAGKAFALMVSAKVIAGFRALVFSLKATQSAMIGVSRASRIMTAAGGPILWISTLAASMVMMTDTRIPLLADGIDSITTKFKDWNKELEQTVDHFGAFDDVASARATKAAQNAFGGLSPSELKGYSGLFSAGIPDDMNIELWSQEQWDNYMRDHLGKDSVAGRDAQRMLDEGRAKIIDLGMNLIADSWEDSSTGLSRTLKQEGRRAVDGQMYYDMFDSLFNISQKTDFASESAAIIFGQNVRTILEKVPDFFHASEAEKIYNDLRATVPAIMKNVSFGDFMVLFGDRVSDELSSVAQSDYQPSLDKMAGFLQLETAKELADAMTKVPLIDGKSAAELKGLPGLPAEVSRYIDHLYQILDMRIAEEAGAAGSFTLDSAAKAIKDGLAQAMDHMFVTAFPDMREIQDIFENTVPMLSDPQEFATVITDLLDETLGNGSTLRGMLLDADFPDTIRKEILASLEKAFSINESPELKALIDQLKDASAEAGEETAKETRRSLLQGIIDGAQYKFGAEEKKAIKALAKLGSPRDMMKSLGKETGKLAAYIATGGRNTAATRSVLLEKLDEIKTIRKTLIARAMKLPMGDRRDTLVRKANRDYIKAMLPTYKDAPPSVRKQMVRDMAKIYAVDQDGVMKMLKGKKGLKKRIRQYYKSLIPDPPKTGGEGSGAAAGVAAQEIVDATAAGTDAATTTKDAGVQLADAVVLGFEESLADGSTAVDNIEDAMSGAVNLAANAAMDPRVKNAGRRIGMAFHSGVRAYLDENTGDILSGRMGALISRATGLTKSDAKTYGGNVAAAWVGGFTEGLNNYEIAISGSFLASLKGESPPKSGPLKDIDKWGENIGEAWSDGVRKGVRSGRQAFEAEGKRGMEIQNFNKKEVRVKLEVTSPDDSVNRQKKGEMREAALEAFSLAGIEHAVTVG